MIMLTLNFFTTIKKLIIKREIYSTHNDTKAETFYKNVLQSEKRYSHTDGVSPVKFEEAYFSELETV